MPLRAAAVLAALAACAHETTPRPPADPAERQRVEFTSCQSGRLPPWLDDAALAEAERLDRFPARAMNPDDSYRPGTVAAQPTLPPPSPSGGASHREAVLSARHEFETRCTQLRSKGQGLAPPPPGGS